MSPAGRWKFSSNVTEFRVIDQIASTAWSASSAITQVRALRISSGRAAGVARPGRPRAMFRTIASMRSSSARCTLRAPMPAQGRARVTHAPAPVAPPAARWTPLDWALLAVITLAGAFLRLWNLRHAPPGIEQDEALGAWMSWCLLHTGRDMSGQPWPIFYAHGIGDSPPTLSFYLTIPFQWLGGLSPVTTRLPGAVAGTLCVPLLAWVADRVNGQRTALVAAALLAFSPWHLFVSRFGVGASECPLEALLPLALLVAAGLLAEEPVRPVLAGLAGLAAGVSCYGFQVMRIYFPVLFALLAWAVWPRGSDHEAK